MDEPNVKDNKESEPTSGEIGAHDTATSKYAATTTSGPAVEAPRKKGSGSTAAGVLGFVAALGVGFFVGKWATSSREPAVEVVEGTRYRVDLHGQEPQAGPDDALVTVVEFADFECPYCAKGAKALMSARESFSEDVRVLFKHYPLPFHDNAIPAARASWAAAQYGKFWQLHDYLYEKRGDINEIQDHVKSLGIDPQEFTGRLLSDEAGATIEKDRLAGAKLKLSGTPVYLVNGHLYSGALSENAWEQIIEAELEDAENLVDQGTARDAVYETLMKSAKDQPVVEGGKAAQKPGRQPGEPAVDQIYRVLPDGRPSLGPDDALVTAVVFSDFECPFCARLGPVLREAAERHEDLRVVFRNMPLPNHAGAEPAALAALAAHRQGKFWEMHDRLFEKGKVSEDDLVEHARALGLDLERFEQDRADPALKEMVAEDWQVARQFGVMSTPTCFINGRYVRGAQTATSLDAAIDEARARAQVVLERGIEPARVYTTLMEEAAPSVQPSEKPGVGEPQDG